MIYLDNAATTKPLDILKELAAAHAADGWMNPSAMYPPAVEKGAVLKAARAAICAPLRARDAVFTSCGTESANTVIFGGWKRQGKKPLHFITSVYEHPCVYESFRTLEAMGHTVDYAEPESDGSIHAKDVAELVRDDTALVSIMHVNNETGAINDIAAIAAAVKAKNPLTAFHADGVQGYIKEPFDMARSKVDYYTVSAHKIHGIKGAGAIFMNKAPRPYIIGGGQEGGVRSGTENTLGIEMFAAAADYMYKNRDEVTRNIAAARAALLGALSDVPDVVMLSPENGAEHILNLSFPGIRGEVLLHLLERDGIYISTGSACSSKKGRISRAHKAMRLDAATAEGSVRISFSKDNTEEESQTAALAIKKALAQYRGFIRR